MNKLNKITLILAIVGGLYGGLNFVHNWWINSHSGYALASDIQLIRRDIDEARQYKLLTDLSDYTSLELTEENDNVKLRYQKMIQRIEKELQIIQERNK